MILLYRKALQLFVLFGTLFCLGACNEPGSSPQQVNRPIVMGDSSLIVTETDPKYLEDMVSDLAPLENAGLKELGKEEKKATNLVDTPKTRAEMPVATLSGPAFKIDFGQGVVLTFSGLETREFQTQDPVKNSGVSYGITKGDISQSTLQVIGLKGSKIAYRYQSYLALQEGSRIFPLKSLGVYLSDWVEQSFDNGSLKLTSLNQPLFKKVTVQEIKNAINPSANQQRMSVATKGDWTKLAQGLKSPESAPAIIKIENVQLKLSGSTQEGHAFFKTIRMDVLGQ